MPLSNLWTTLKFVIGWKNNAFKFRALSEYAHKATNPLCFVTKQTLTKRLTHHSILFLSKKKLPIALKLLRKKFNLFNSYSYLNYHPNSLWSVNTFQTLKQINLLGFSQYSKYAKSKTFWHGAATNSLLIDFKSTLTSLLSFANKKFQNTNFNTKLFLFENYVSLKRLKFVMPLARFYTKASNNFVRKLQTVEQPFLFLNDRRKLKNSFGTKSSILWSTFKKFFSNRFKLANTYNSITLSRSNFFAPGSKLLNIQNRHRKLHIKTKRNYVKTLLTEVEQLPWNKVFKPLLVKLKHQKLKSYLLTKKMIFTSKLLNNIKPNLNSQKISTLTPWKLNTKSNNNFVNKMIRFSNSKLKESSFIQKTRRKDYAANSSLTLFKKNFVKLNWRSHITNSDILKKNMSPSRFIMPRLEKSFRRYKFKLNTYSAHLYNLYTKLRSKHHIYIYEPKQARFFFWKIFKLWTFPKRLRFKPKRRISFLNPPKKKKNNTVSFSGVNTWTSSIINFKKYMQSYDNFSQKTTYSKSHGVKTLSSLKTLIETFRQLRRVKKLSLPNSLSRLSTRKNYTNHSSSIPVNFETRQSYQYFNQSSVWLLRKNLIYVKSILFHEFRRAPWFMKKGRPVTNIVQLKSVYLARYMKAHLISEKQRRLLNNLKVSLAHNKKSQTILQKLKLQIRRIGAPENRTFISNLKVYARAKLFSQSHKLSTMGNPFNANFIDDKSNHFKTCTLKTPTLTARSSWTKQNLTKEQIDKNLLIKPKYSTYFVSSPFSFLQLIGLSTAVTKTMDIVHLTSWMPRTPRYVLFPDGNVIKANLFKQLNKQKLLFQTRQHLHDLYTNTEIGYNTKLLDKRQSISYLNTVSTSLVNTSFYSIGSPISLSTLTLPEQIWKDSFKLVPHRRVSVRIPRIRFKPGYGRIWRTARRAVQEFLDVSIRYQYRLTPKIQKMYIERRLKRVIDLSFTLGAALLSTKLTPDNWYLEELLSSETVFLNGMICYNKNTRLFVNDFIQLIISIKFYIVIKWLKGWATLKRNRVNRIFYRKHRPFRRNKTPKLSKNLPLWFFDLQYSYSDVPRYFELDYFTLSIFVLLNPIIIERWMPIRIGVFDWNILNMYNWKYIT